MRRYISTALAALVLVLAVACGGSDSSSTTGSTSGTMSVMATGTITGFGSIYVNGVHFQTSHAVIHKNGAAVSQSQLAVGEIARVKGVKHADGTGDADSIDVDENVVGPIDSLDSANSMLTVLGQKVKINSGTSFSADIQPQGIDGLSVGETIRVCGTVDASGNIVATRIATSAPGSAMQVIGTVSNFDSSSHSFRINALNVDYSGAMLNDFPSGQLGNGDLVEVRGNVYVPSTTTLTATQVERVHSEHEDADGGSEIEREGLITRFVSATDFDVTGQPVTTNDSTTYRNGTKDDLALNVKVEVEGSYDSNNVLVASVVAFHHNGGILLQSQVTAVDATAGTLTVLGVTVNVTSMTRVEDHAMSHDEMFNLGDISVGDIVEVRGYESPAGSGALLATRLEREPASSPAIVAGPFGAASSPTFTVFGVTVDASSAVLKSATGATLTYDEFVTQATGQSVAAIGTLSGTIVLASAAWIMHTEDHGDN